MTSDLAKAIERVSDNLETTRLVEPGNMADGLFAIARAIDRLARAYEAKEGIGLMSLGEPNGASLDAER